MAPGGRQARVPRKPVFILLIECFEKKSFEKNDAYYLSQWVAGSVAEDLMDAPVTVVSIRLSNMGSSFGKMVTATVYITPIMKREPYKEILKRL